MKELLQKLHNSERVSGMYGLLALLILLHSLLQYPERFLIWSGHEQIFETLRLCYACLILLLFILFVLKLRKGLSAELLLLMGYSAWMLVTRILVRDYSLFGELYFSALCFLVFAAGAFLRRKARWRLLEASAGLLGGILCVFAILAIVVLYLGEDAVPGLSAYVRLLDEEPPNISFFNIYRTYSASWFALGLFLFASVYFGQKGKSARFLLIPASVLMLFVIVHQNCRSINIAVSFGAAMLCLLWLLPRMRAWKSPARLGAAAVTVCLLGAIFYKGIGACDEALLRGVVLPRAQTETSGSALPSASPQPAAEAKRQSEDEEEPLPIRDTRGFLEDVLTLTNRTRIWRAGLETIAEDPSIALFGQKEEGMMERVNKYGNYMEFKQHMHNTHMQALMLTGIPGFLCQLAFSVLLLIRMIRCYFSEETELRERILTIFLATAMLYGFMEALLSRALAFPSLWYLLVAGVFVENERERLLHG